MEVTPAGISLDIVNGNLISVISLLQIQLTLMVIMVLPILKGMVDKWFKL